MVSRSRSRRTTINLKDARTFLLPVTAVLSGWGLNKKEALDAFAKAHDYAAKTRRVRNMEFIGNPLQYADVISLWTRNKRFLDERGKPRVLSMGDRNGFSALVKQAQHRISPKNVLSVLVRYGNVCRTTTGRYSLVRTYFNTAALTKLAFEPHAYFLADLSATLKDMLMSSKRRYPPPFWRKVESLHISEAEAKKFFEFARQRTRIFLDEIDDWLEAHRKPGTRGRRVGLGVFSVYSTECM